MTTSVSAKSACDLFVDNEVFNFRRSHFSSAKALAGICWIATGNSSQAALVPALMSALSSIEENLPNHGLFFLAGTSAWQPDTRVVRHYKLWRALSLRGLEVPQGGAEDVVESDGKLKFFGVVKLSDFSNLDAAAKVLLDERATYIVAFPGTEFPNQLAKVGWLGDLSADSNFIDGLTNSGGLLIKGTGEFQANERCVVVIGDPSKIRGLEGALKTQAQHVGHSQI